MTFLEERLTEKIRSLDIPTRVEVETTPTLVRDEYPINGHYDQFNDLITIYLKDYSILYSNIVATLAHEASHALYCHKNGLVGKKTLTRKEAPSEGVVWREGLLISDKFGVKKEYLEQFSVNYMKMFDEAIEVFKKSVSLSGTSKDAAISLLQIEAVLHSIPLPLPNLPEKVRQWLIDRLGDE